MKGERGEGGEGGGEARAGNPLCDLPPGLMKLGRLRLREVSEVTQLGGTWSGLCLAPASSRPQAQLRDQQGQ